MNLVNIGNNYYINMDLLTGVWYDGVQYYASLIIDNNISISESAYNTILKYGNARI